MLKVNNCTIKIETNFGSSCMSKYAEKQLTHQNFEEGRINNYEMFRHHRLDFLQNSKKKSLKGWHCNPTSPFYLRFKRKFLNTLVKKLNIRESIRKNKLTSMSYFIFYEDLSEQEMFGGQRRSNTIWVPHIDRVLIKHLIKHCETICQFNSNVFDYRLATL